MLLLYLEALQIGIKSPYLDLSAIVTAGQQLSIGRELDSRDLSLEIGIHLGGSEGVFD